MSNILILVKCFGLELFLRIFNLRVINLGQKDTTHIMQIFFYYSIGKILRLKCYWIILFKIVKVNQCILSLYIYKTAFNQSSVHVRLISCTWTNEKQSSFTCKNLLLSFKNHTRDKLIKMYLMTQM